MNLYPVILMVFGGLIVLALMAYMVNRDAKAR